MVQEIVGVIESVAQFGDYRRTQKKECYGVARRMKHLLPLSEEIRDLERPIPETGMAVVPGRGRTSGGRWRRLRWRIQRTRDRRRGDLVGQ